MDQTHSDNVKPLTPAHLIDEVLSSAPSQWISRNETLSVGLAAVGVAALGLGGVAWMRSAGHILGRAPGLTRLPEVELGTENALALELPKIVSGTDPIAPHAAPIMEHAIEPTMNGVELPANVLDLAEIRSQPHGKAFLDAYRIDNPLPTTDDFSALLLQYKRPEPKYYWDPRNFRALFGSDGSGFMSYSDFTPPKPGETFFNGEHALMPALDWDEVYYGLGTFEDGNEFAAGIGTTVDHATTMDNATPVRAIPKLTLLINHEYKTKKDL